MILLPPISNSPVSTYLKGVFPSWHQDIQARKNTLVALVLSGGSPNKNIFLAAVTGMNSTLWKHYCSLRPICLYCILSLLSRNPHYPDNQVFPCFKTIVMVGNFEKCSCRSYLIFYSMSRLFFYHPMFYQINPGI